MHLTQVHSPTASVIFSYVILICDFYTFKPVPMNYTFKYVNCMWLMFLFKKSIDHRNYLYITTLTNNGWKYLGYAQENLWNSISEPLVSSRLREEYKCELQTWIETISCCYILMKSLAHQRDWYQWWPYCRPTNKRCVPWWTIMNWTHMLTHSQSHKYTVLF